MATVVERMLQRYVDPEQGYRVGLMRTAEKYGSARMNAACERALSGSTVGGPNRRSIEVILERGLDLQPTGTPIRLSPTPSATASCTTPTCSPVSVPVTHGEHRNLAVKTHALSTYDSIKKDDQS